MASVSTQLNDLSYLGGPDYNSKILWISDSNFELLPVQSPLLRQSLLISFPPLINMLKSSGSSYLISGANKSFIISTAHKWMWLLLRACTWWEIFSHIIFVNLFAHTETSMLVLASASCVQRSDDSWFCNSHCISHSSCVLHRYGSQDIHRWKFRFLSTSIILWFWLD